MTSRTPFDLVRPHPVLYVDDEEANRIVFEASFADQLDVTCVGSGEEALRRLASEPYDVLLTDQRMPGMSGVELCERVRSSHPAVERIIITAYTEQAAVMRAINQGRVSAFLTKPWNTDEVVRTLREAQASAHQARIAGEIVQAMQIRGQAEAQRQVLHDLANVASRVIGCCDELEDLYPSMIGTMPPPIANAFADELQGLRQAVEFLKQLHTSVPGLHDHERASDVLGLHHIVHSALAVAQSQLPDGTCIEVECDADLTVVCDRTDLGRILVNLVVNAGHAMVEAQTPNPTLRIEATGHAEHVQLRVSDNGPGVPQALRDRIFEPRFTTRPARGGTGLGLSIARQLMEANHGSLRLVDNDGIGATFELRMVAPSGLVATS
ncbi:MAG: hybrid sensor histidine kinase/response regulator [Myxococcota bacterium]